MHKDSFNITIDELTKVEGAAKLEVEVKNGMVQNVKFGILEYKRFYTQALRGKPIAAMPQLLARICGTCSNAHILASIESVEKTLGIKPSPQTMILRKLTFDGLIIRDHALHLYLFVLPDILEKNSILDLDENDEREHQLLHDAFRIKAAGNYLSQVVAGRSVHAPYPTIGGFTHILTKSEAEEAIKKLEEIRPAVLRLIELFQNTKFEFNRPVVSMALVADPFTYLEGTIKTSEGLEVPESEYREHLDRVVMPYSEASAYIAGGKPYRVGALSRFNLSKHTLHKNTLKDAKGALDMFPSDNVFLGNLAQAVEILNSIDRAKEVLADTSFTDEKPSPPPKKAGVGVGVVEAPRGTLYHKLETDDKGIVKHGEVIVPTGQNQLTIELDIKEFIQNNIDMDRDKLTREIEKIIRAYDPCMSCAAHFLELDWKES